jgi:hypothetical protein
MATRRTLDLLPSVFQTDTNRKFLSATLDQLVSEPAFDRLNGFIGRKFAPTYVTTDSYIQEIDNNRQNYQVEPSVIIKNNDSIDFYSNYPDLINKISYYGGITTNHDRLFSNEYYTFNGLFDQDKFVNYQQYFWLPDGPLPIKISAEFVESQKTFTFINDEDSNCIRIEGQQDDNPEIVLSRGGLYKFVVNQPGQPIFIQTEPGISGNKTVQPNQSSRDVYGITNNGIDVGVIEFRVPLEDNQDVYLKMPHGATVDYIVDLSFTSVDGAIWDNIVSQFGGFDSMQILPTEKTIIFTNFSNSDTDWVQQNGMIVPPSLRHGVYKIKITQNDNQQNVINLNYLNDVSVNTRVYVRLGKSSANTEYYLNSSNQFIQIPTLTAQLGTLYYQNLNYTSRYGKIRLVNNAVNTINVETSILGKKYYTSPSKIDFTNGMIVSFDHTIEPKKYANKKFVVEGVGQSIRLVDFSNLVYPESGVNIKEVEWDISDFDSNKFGQTYLGSITPEYIVMNRSSLDLNAWSRQNRWFHIDIINKSAELNNEIPVLNQAVRAQRPIIEFHRDLQLFNNGRIGKTPVDHINTSHTHAFSQIQNSSTLVNGISLKKGQRVLFANDVDPLVRSQVYIVDYISQSQQSYKSIYDSQGSGTITIDPPTVDFRSKSSPEYINTDSQGLFNWKWIIQGPTSLLSAIRITRLTDIVGASNGIITNVVMLSSNQYEISFTTTFQIDNFDSSTVDIIGPGGRVSIRGDDTNFTTELEVGTELYAENDVFLGIVSGIMENNRAQLELPSTMALTNAVFWYKKPRVQLLISSDPDDTLLPYDTLVAKDGENKGKTFWYDGNKWILAQLKDSVNKPILFDTFDSNEKSFSTYKLSRFTGTKIFSYKVGTGANDPVLGFPISYTSNYSVADITFYHDFTNDVFQYKDNTTDVTQQIETGYLRQNTSRYDFIKRNSWATVNELSHQYQIISKTFTGETNYFEIDITGKTTVFNPTIKVFLNNKLLESTQYRSYVKVNKRNTVLIASNLLTVGDKVDILILSNETSAIGYYQIPYNLEYNSKNESFSTITLGQLRNNLSVVGQGIHDIVGSVPGNSNLRDVDTDGYNGNILQSSAPLIYANLFLINDTSNFINSIEFARREYSKFKNKFLELCSTLKGLDTSDPVTSVDKILLTINNVKNKTFPWYYSDMVPYGDTKKLAYPIVDTLQRKFRLQSFFNDTKIQNKAVLVYLNNQQLIKDVDYTFEKLSPIVTLSESIITVNGDVLLIKEYASTDANFIPETPTKLGLYQKFVPEIFNDTTYRTPINVVRGHDGSLTPCFNDFRDQFLLELEKRIFNNIKDDPTKQSIDIRTLIPGRFRPTEYSLGEYTSILNTSFVKWVGSNKLDYTTNSYFLNGDPFTYNYRQTSDSLFKERIPGYWRGIYQYFYDTEKPHSHPWEMLGFTDQPTWWQSVYGPSPYTKDNTLLWADLEAGLIQQGPRAGIDKNYSRPGLSQIIPVDSNGDLVSPMAHIAIPLNTQTVEQSFIAGDVGPVEAAWRRTSEFPFAMQIAAALMKPAVYFGTLMDTNDYYKNSFYNQYLCESTNKRISPNSIKINGELVNGVPSRAKGYINWVVDYMTSTGIIGTTKMRSLLSNLQVQLSYKAAGYVDKKYITILAEQYSPTSTNESVIIPDDSYTIHLNKSVPVSKIVYSAVIIEKTSAGYSLSGYNLNSPYFIVIPSETSADKYIITVENTSATIYNSFRKERSIIPYGTVYNTKQQVVDFLVSYQRALILQGFVFDAYDTDLAQTKDWILSAKEFLTWTLQGWKAGNLLILSPVNNVLSVLTTTSVVDQITNTSNGSKLLDPNFNSIKTGEITVLRDSGEFKVTSINGKTIAFAEFNLVQFEHILIFNNTTIFNDIIYKPETGNRQFRLKLVGNKTSNWDGSLYAPGFVYNNETVQPWRAGKDYSKGDLVIYKQQYYVATQKIAALTQFDFNNWTQIPKTNIKTGLLSNFSNNAGKFTNFYDVDASTLDKQLSQMRGGLLGFRSRDYLNDLNLNQTSQTKFYQGLIKNKGTSQSITNLASVKFNELTNSVKFYEEWALRVGEYGALSSNAVVEIILNEQVSKQNPFALCITDETNIEDGIILIKNKDLYDRPFEPGPVNFINRPIDYVSENDIQSAGYVNINDVNALLFDINLYQTLNVYISDVISGYRVWVAKDYKKDWNVYRASETDTQVEKIEYNLDNVAKVFTKDPHNLTGNPMIAIKNFDNLVNGFYIVNSVTGLREFTIALTAAQSQILKKKTILSNGQLFVMNSIRFNSPANIDDFTPRYGWKDNDLVWVDKDQHNHWSVIKKNNLWNYETNLPIEIQSDSTEIRYGASVKLTKKYVFAGAPGDRGNIGQVYVFDKTTLNQLNIINPLYYENNIKSLGHSIDFNNRYLVAGAPDSNGQRGLILVYRFQDNSNTVMLPSFVVESPTTTVGAQFGYSVSLSADNEWLYAGAPGENAVYIYKLVNEEFAFNGYEINSFDYGCVLPYTVTDIQSIEVLYQDFLLRPNIDYYVENNNTVKFIDPPENPMGRIIITRRAYYAFKGKINGDSTTEFGYSIKTNDTGSLIFVGAPGASYGSTIPPDDLPSDAVPFTTDNSQSILQAGKVYLYNNNVTAEVLDVSLSDNTFELTTPSYRARFGSCIDYATSTGAVYIGAPGYSTYTYSGGLVSRYVNALVNQNYEYVLAQEIVRPMYLNSENFGSFVKVSAADTILAISSTYGTAKNIGQFDKKQTIFDGGATIFLDITLGTGSVYLHDYMPGGDAAHPYGSYIFGTEFNAPNLQYGDQFGCSVDFNNTEMYIGASYNDTYGKNVGAVYLQTNSTGAPVWSIIKKQQPKVDPMSINSVSLYNKNTKTKLVSLDYIDPAKGKLLGIVDQNLNYKTSRDPAMYNAGTLITNTESINLHWGAQQVGQTWWNLDSIRYIDYEQGELIYRLNNWGNLFPGSTVSVYEWVESDFTPLQYVANGESGTPLHSDNRAFVQINYSDISQGNIKTKYYFWVSGLTTVDSTKSRVLSIQGIKNAILDPKTQSIPYAALLSNNSIALFNCDDYASSTNVILKIDYDVIPNSNLIHSEFELLQEGNPSSLIPKKLINKLVDSLAGADSQLRRVPELSLNPNQLIGLETRPRQTLIVNRLAALRNLAKFANSIFKTTLAAFKLQTSEKFKNALWFKEEPKPTNFDHVAANLTELSYIKLVPGDTILIENDDSHFGLWTLHVVKPNLSLKMIKNQSYRTPDLWTYKNWYKEGFSSDIIPTFVVDYYKDIEKIPVAAGDIVQVNNTAASGFELYLFSSPTENELIAVENGTVEINEEVWNKPVVDGGFDTQAFEDTIFDKDQSTECRNLISGLFEDIFTDELSIHHNDMIFTLVRYILSEQKNVDWIFKTSFISILHNIKKLAQYPNYVKDNHDYYESYINEIKPYKTKIREYKISYAGDDVSNTAISDFDLPGYYDQELNQFRSPNGELPVKDGMLFTQPEYSDWANNRLFGVEAILINNGGTGYTTDVQVKIISNGDGGTGATATAVVNEVTGTITSIHVTNSGHGYKNTPYVFISGIGTGANVYGLLANRKIRSIKTVLKFDRVTHNTTVREWQPNVVYNYNDLVSFNGVGYKAKFTNSSSVFALGNFTLLRGDDYHSANDRLASTYNPGPNQIQKDISSTGKINLTRLIPGTSYEANAIQSFTDVFNETNLEGPLSYDRFTGTGPFDINVNGGKFVDVTKQYSPEEMVAGTTTDSLSMCVSTIITDPHNALQQKIVKYRIVKNTQDEPTYVVVAKEGLTRLAKDLNYNDTEIYLQDISMITVPNYTSKIPGFLYINGEKIKFWRIDVANNTILYPIRGVDSTGIPLTHPVNTLVEDQSPVYNVPNTTAVDWDQHIFTTKTPIFKPFFRVHPDIKVTSTRLGVFNSATKLQEGIDYTLELNEFGGVNILFVQESLIKDGVKFDASYTTEKSWLNIGDNTPADGSGLTGSITPSAIFMKRYTHDLTS